MLHKARLARYLVDQGCHKDIANMIVAYYPPVWRWFAQKWMLCKGNATEFFEKYLPTEILRLRFMDQLVKSGLLPLLKFAMDNECPVDRWSCAYAAEYGQLDIVKFLIKNHIYFWGEDTCIRAASTGHLNILQWLRNKDIHKKNVCPWGAVVCMSAATNGHLEVLKWLRNKDIHGEDVCPWDARTCCVAAQNGHLEVLKWIRNKDIHGENVCPWNSQVSLSALNHGHTEVVKWLINRDIHGDDICPSSINILRLI